MATNTTAETMAPIILDASASAIFTGRGDIGENTIIKTRKTATKL
jgi:hypothetical protein